MKIETKDISEIYIEFYKDLLKKYETLTENLIEILKQLKTDCREQSVEELVNELNNYKTSSITLDKDKVETNFKGLNKLTITKDSIKQEIIKKED